VTRVSDVLVLNADMEPLTRVSLRHAVRMLVRQVAEVHDHVPDRAIGVWPVPTVVRLVRWVYARWRHTDGPAWSRRGVLARDHRRCGYCRQPASTVDHIVPRSQGGQNTWLNTIAACYACNQRKADRTPAKAGMVLRFEPRTPTWASAAHA
jgi:5-methylcytosine-specific restriction endonuclease McrA